MNPNDSFSFNEAFTSPLARIKIMQIASKVESPKEREETQEMVDEERKHQVEVCLYSKFSSLILVFSRSLGRVN